MKKLKSLLDVTKPKQTLLLMVTFFVSYFVAGGHIGLRFLYSAVATYLAVAGTTALNMWLDRDIDALMPRTKNRPVPSGILTPVECAIFGTILFTLSIAISTLVNYYLSIVLFAGLFFDIVIYTVLLKRRSPYSIVLGGVAGAMPALAGWVSVDGFSLAGLIVATIVLLWIPSHIWYISMHYEEDYRMAGIPMYPLIVGMERASWAIVFATAIMLILAAALYVLLPLNLLYLVISISAILFFLYKAVKFAMNPSRERAKKMYKLASMTLGIVYISMLLGVFL